MTKEILKQALEALESDNPYIRQLAANAIRNAPERPVQEPTPWRDMVVVSLVREGINKHKARELADHFVNFTLTPPLPAQRQPLTDEEIAEVAERMEAIDATSSFWREFARAIEAALGIKEEA